MGNSDTFRAPAQGRELLDQAGWGALAQAVVYQACEDYRQCVRGLRRKPDDRKLCRRLRSLEHFFVSRWFTTISDLDGRKLLSRLKDEAEHR